jgi:uncharacterized protein (TIGR02118 family)
MTLRVVTLLQRRPDLTHAQFLEHWHTTHATLALRLPGLLSYSQTDVDETLGKSGDESSDLVPDGLAELTFASWDDRASAYSSPEGRALLADGAYFISASRSYIVGQRRKLRRVRLFWGDATLAFSRGGWPGVWFARGGSCRGR